MIPWLTLEDRIDITDLFSRYCYLLDRNHGVEWLKLFTPEGSFEIVGVLKLVGSEQLAGMPDMFAKQSGGKWRHQMMNVLADPAAAPDEASVTVSGLITDWSSGFRAVSLADYEARLRKADGRWRIVELKATMMEG